MNFSNKSTSIELFLNTNLASNLCYLGRIYCSSEKNLYETEHGSSEEAYSPETEEKSYERRAAKR